MAVVVANAQRLTSANYTPHITLAARFPKPKPREQQPKQHKPLP